MTVPQKRDNLRTDPRQIAPLIGPPLETWRPVVGVEGYFVSDRGRVCSIDRVVMRPGVHGGEVFRRGRVLRPKRQGSGHLKVTLSACMQQFVHLLVLRAFVGPAPHGCEGLHGDDDTDNNTLSNLRWGTRTENLYDAIRNGKKPIGERNWNAKLTETDVRFIRANSHLSSTHLGRSFGVSRSAIDKIKEFRMWRHIS